MRLPEQIRIGAIEHEVKITDNLNDGCSMLYGRINHAQAEIEINDHVDPQHACVTLWHEIVHALLYQHGVVLEDETEERVAEALGFGIYKVLEDNIDRLYEEREVYEQSYPDRESSE